VPQRIGVFEWQKAVCSEHGPSSSVARLILMVVSLHMDPDGGNAWPSQETIAERAAITSRCVVTHLGNAVRLGWLRRYTAGRTKQDWRLNGYEATVPDDVYPLLKGAERHSPRRVLKSGEGGSEPSTKGDAPGSKRVVKLVQKGGEGDSHYLSRTSSITKEGAASPSPAKAGSAAQEQEPEPWPDAKLRLQVQVLRAMRWSDDRILAKHGRHGMTSSHLADGNPGGPT
jgi:hypothetical protein